jgi:hypothetical protein
VFNFFSTTFVLNALFSVKYLASLILSLQRSKRFVFVLHEISSVYHVVSATFVRNVAFREIFIVFHSVSAAFVLNALICVNI